MIALQMCYAHRTRKHYSQEQALEWITQTGKGLRYLHTSKPKVTILSQLSSVQYINFVLRLGLQIRAEHCQWHLRVLFGTELTTKTGTRRPFFTHMLPLRLCGEMQSWKTS